MRESVYPYTRDQCIHNWRQNNSFFIEWGYTKKGTVPLHKGSSRHGLGNNRWYCANGNIPPYQPITVLLNCRDSLYA